MKATHCLFVTCYWGCCFVLLLFFFGGGGWVFLLLLLLLLLLFEDLFSTERYTRTLLSEEIG